MENGRDSKSLTNFPLHLSVLQTKQSNAQTEFQVTTFLFLLNEVD